ncbi:nitrous oxide reductase family maturation protein NosD, partial [Azospirillum brasilense]
MPHHAPLPLFAAALVFAAGTACAATVTVAPGGLDGALAAATAGDTLVLAPGTHPGP